MNESQSLASLEAKVVRIAEMLSARQSRLKNSARLTAIIGSLLCILMAVYFGYFYWLFQQIATPDKLVGVIENRVDAMLPDARKKLEEHINSNAKNWAKQASQSVQENIPEVRRKAEDFIVARASAALDEVQVLSAQRFRTFVQNNQAQLADGFRSLSKPEDADQFVADLQVAIEKEMGRDIHGQAEEAMHMLFDLNNKLETLKKGDRLNNEQALEREILMIAKRLQLESATGESMAPKKSGSGGAGGVAADEPAPATEGESSEKIGGNGAKPDDQQKADDSKKSKVKKSADAEKPAKEEPKEPESNETKKESDEAKKESSSEK
jgi:flagellar basal body-associated protein FliL